jgi:4-amino-4-deoxy-L-arabinose transferase-like glycosyltransferase
MNALAGAVHGATRGATASTPGEIEYRKAIVFAVALGLVCLLALGLRVHQLGSIPNGFHVDEASIGFNARCILETGRDEHGVRFPLYFKAFGEYKNPVFIYTCVPVTALFGSDVFGVRLTSALFGAATVVATGLLGAALLGRWGGFLAALLLSFSPWHLQLSRIAFEAVSLPLFVTLAVWLLVMAERRPRLLVVAAVPLAVATYCYGVAKLFVPLLVVGFVVLRARWLWQHRKTAAGALALLVILVLPNLHATLAGDVQARFEKLSIATHPAAQAAGREAWQASPVARHGPDWLRESRAAATATAFVLNYRAHLSPSFLVTQGDANPRHNPGGGMLSRTEAIAAAIGLLAVIVGLRRWTFALLLWWLVIAPVPASLTASGIPHGIRTIDLLPLPQVLAAMGILTLTSIEKSGWAWAADRLRGSRIGRAWRPGRRRVLPAVTVVVMIVLLSADAARHLTWYFNVFPREVWRPFFWEENAVAKTIRERPGVDRVFIGPRSQRIYDVTLLFFLCVSTQDWLRDGEVPRVERRYPDPDRLEIGDIVVCVPDDPRFRHLPLATRLVNPAGEAFADFRGPAGTTPGE